MENVKVTEEEIEAEAERRYPVNTHSKPNNSPYIGTKETFIHGVMWALNSLSLPTEPKQEEFSPDAAERFAYDALAPFCYNGYLNDEIPSDKLVAHVASMLRQFKGVFPIRTEPATFKCNRCGHNKKFWSVKNDSWYCDQCKHYIEGQ